MHLHNEIIIFLDKLAVLPGVNNDGYLAVCHVEEWRQIVVDAGGVKLSNSPDVVGNVGKYSDEHVVDVVLGGEMNPAVYFAELGLVFAQFTFRRESPLRNK